MSTEHTIERLNALLRGHGHRTNDGEFLWRSHFDEAGMLEGIALRLLNRVYHVGRGTIVESTRVVCEQPPTRLSVVETSLRSEVETIVFKALEKNSERRYQSVFGLAQDIRRFLSGEAIVARPPLHPAQ